MLPQTITIFEREGRKFNEGLEDKPVCQFEVCQRVVEQDDDDGVVSLVRELAVLDERSSLLVEVLFAWPGSGTMCLNHVFVVMVEEEEEHSRASPYSTG